MTDEEKMVREQQAMQVDREDLLGLLTLRFGGVTNEVQEAIMNIEQLETLERLILVAANVPEWQRFVDELQAGGTVFKIVGDYYDPISTKK